MEFSVSGFDHRSAYTLDELLGRWLGNTWKKIRSCDFNNATAIVQAFVTIKIVLSEFDASVDNIDTKGA